MRGVIGLILAGLGAFLILVAILLPTWVSGQVIKFPLSENETAVLQASNASYFSAATLKEQTGVTMQATYTIKGEPSKGSSSTAVWNRQQRLRPDQPPVGPADDAHVRVRPAHRAAGRLLRRERQRQHVGPADRVLVGYVFPFGTQKQTYQVFDTTLNRPMPFVYSGTTTVGGIQTYEFVENVPPTQFTTQAVPGSMLGGKTAVVRAP